MIKDKTIKNISNFLAKKCNCSTITTLNQASMQGKKEKSLFVMFFLFNKIKISFDVIFRKNYFFVTDLKIKRI
jgi:hypothetical protein